MIDFHNIVSAMALVMGLLAARAFIPNLLSVMSPAASSLAWGFFAMALGALGRAVYWSWGRVLLDGHWTGLRDAVGGLNVNVGFDTLLLIGLYLVLRARLLSLPEHERRRHNIFTAITYPEPFNVCSLLRRR